MVTCAENMLYFICISKRDLFALIMDRLQDPLWSTMR